MGWIKLERKITEHFLWEDKPFSKGQAWIDLLLLANHKEHKAPYKGKIVTCKRGEVDRSISWLAKRWGWSRSKVRDFLHTLEADQMVVLKTSTHRTTVTIENYAFYQDVPTTNLPTNRQQTDSKPTASRHIQERKKDKKDKNNNNSALRSAAVPTLSEVKDFIDANGYAVDAEEFVDYYEGQGWTKANGRPVKDWQACVRSWHSRNARKDAGRASKAEARRARLAEIEKQEQEEIEEMNRKAKEFRKGKR